MTKYTDKRNELEVREHPLANTSSNFPRHPIVWWRIFVLIMLKMSTLM